VPNTITIRPERARPISPLLFGAFFEDLNYAADGGLYAELIQNRSFEYSSADNGDWNFLTAWEIVRHHGDCTVAEGSAEPLHPNNPHYLVLHVTAPGGEAGLRNGGYGGINLHAGEFYTFSCFVRRLSGELGPLHVQLVGRKGALLAEELLPAPGAGWQQLAITLCPSTDEPFAACHLLFQGVGTLALDMVSLYPSRTFCNQPNGLRPDLAQALAELKPRFLRFPGGCLVHGDGLANLYRWQDTVGPRHTRRAQPNIWSYHQSAGLGYYEYFQLCENLGAVPLPVVPAGVCCPNSEARFTGAWEQGQCGLPLDEMPAYIQEVLDLVEWANGPADSRWGAVRAAAGHPQPFGLRYLGLGNEDQITPVFRARFAMIYAALQAKHPEITVVGTVGPYTSGVDYEAGWQFARELGLPVVDEHGYHTPEWFWANLSRYDAYDRAGPHVYLGEYAAHDIGRRNTLRAALAEAACMTALERNGDVVCMASYAPLLGKRGHMQWTPNLICFDNQRVTRSINYYVQQLFSTHAGDTYLPADLSLDDAAGDLAVSCVREGPTGDIILKLVSRAPAPVELAIDLSRAGDLPSTATCITLTGDPLAENEFGRPPCIAPQTAEIPGGPHFTCTVPPHSLCIIRLGPGSAAS
jgi:alpha-L-arabinofuranosidase